MDKSTLYLVTIIIAALIILGVSGEYFTYKYYTLLATRSVSQTAASVVQNSTANQLPSGSSEKSIVSFNFENPMAVGSIDETNHTVTITVPPITDVTRLAPTIETSTDAAISPSSGTQQDFTNPVVYKVTAQNGSTQNYTVTVNVASILESIGESITSFKLSGFNPVIEGFIDNNAHTVYLVVPDGTDLTKLTPTIEVSDGATVSPESGSIQDFTNPVIYTVTDSYGDTQSYTVTVVTESNSG